jgi:hypothetical protein
MEVEAAVESETSARLTATLQIVTAASLLKQK